MKTIFWLLLLIVFAPMSTNAHSAVTSTNQDAGALFHLSPEEEPYYDVPTSISIELNGLKNFNKEAVYPRLTVRLPSNKEFFIPTVWHDEVLVGEFTFEQTGRHALILELVDNADSQKINAEFNHTVLVRDPNVKEPFRDKLAIILPVITVVFGVAGLTTFVISLRNKKA